MKELRPHQAEAFQSLRRALGAGFKKPVLQAPTGYGKTLLAATIIASARTKGKRVLFVVPAISLVDQTVRAFWDEGVRDVGVIQASHAMTDFSKPVQIASVQTLEKRTIDKPDLIIVDECHRVFEVIKRLMEEWPDVPFIGLSATPWTKGLARLYDTLIISATTASLIKDGYLCPFRVFAPSHPDLTGVKVTNTPHGRDYADGELSTAMQKGTLTGDIVTTWLARAEGRPTLCFGVDRAHAMALHNEFEREGVASAYQDAQTTAIDREIIRKKFAAGTIKVVCNIGTLTTGVDWDVRCIILARPTRSEILMTQIIGRGLRTSTGKDYLLLLDHSDTTLTLGFVTDIRYEKLDDGKLSSKTEEYKPALPRACPSCEVLLPKFARICPVCKFEPSLQARGVDTEAGELVELDAKRKAKANKEAGWPEKVAFIRELRRYQLDHGRKDGWVGNAYRDKYGVWPVDSRVKYETAASEVSPLTASWIRAKNIRFAKAMQKKNANVG